MDRKRGWLRWKEWWTKEGWAFKLKFTEEIETQIGEDEYSVLQLQDVVQYVTQVEGIGKLEVRFEALFDALASSKPSLIKHISMMKVDITDADVQSLARAIESGCLQSLECLKIRSIPIGNGHSTLAKAMVSGGLPSLKTLIFIDVKLEDVHLEAYGIALRSGKLLNLSHLDISSNNIGNEGAKSLGLAIQSGKLKNLAELGLSYNDITDEGVIALARSFKEGEASLLPKLMSLDLSYNPFWEVGLLSFAEALESGLLNSLKVLDVESWLLPSKTVANALVASLLSNHRLTADVKCDWSRFPELDRRRKQLIERNDVLAGLIKIPKVQAKFGKVYLCGNPEVGKTTLRRTLQRSFLTSLFTWERMPHVEKPTRGIHVSQLSSEGNKPGESPITLLVWDMAGQEDFHVVHNSFFRDFGFAEGNATTFIVVCNFNDSPDNSVEQLEYWLRYIASSCDKTIGKTPQNPRHVFVVTNNIGGRPKIHAEQWKRVLEGQRHKFMLYLKIQTDLFLVDVRKFQQVQGLKSGLLEHSRNLLTNQKVPRICHAIQRNLSVFCQGREQFPVIHWAEFVEQVHHVDEPWLEETIEAATKYSNESGVLIYINTEGVRLVVVDPNWLCSEIIGKVFLPRDIAKPKELLFREQVDQSTGSISISSFKKFFKSLEREWNDAQVNDMIAILLWLGLCYKGKDQRNVFIPALIAENRTPGYPWYLQSQEEDVREQRAMGYSVSHQETEVALAPISLWHRFQVDLAQTPEFNGQRRQDNDFVADKYFVTFVMDYINVLIEVDANLDKPTFEEISILVMQRFEREELDTFEREQRQVDLANDLVERLLKHWNQVCPGVEYEQKVICPWPASCPRPKGMPERHVAQIEHGMQFLVLERGVGRIIQWVVAIVKEWILELGVGRIMQWVVSFGDSITEDQSLSTKEKRDSGIFSSSRTSGIKGYARQGNDSLFELHRPDNTPRIQIVFFHGLQMANYSDAHLSTWQSGDGSTIWPQTWLVDEIAGAHVLSVSYRGGMRHSSDGSVDMYNIEENLLSDLLDGGVGQEPDCPVVLVGHSIGGLVIKELCLRAHNKLNSSSGYERAQLEKLINNLKGIFYYSTPHHGSGVAEISAKKLSSPLLTYFETLSKATARLNSEFEAICKVNYKHCLFAGLVEGLPTNMDPFRASVTPTSSSVEPEASASSFVVPEASARGDLEKFSVVEDADHYSVCRPKSKATKSFYKLRNFVSHIASKASDAEMIPQLGSTSS